MASARVKPKAKAAKSGATKPSRAKSVAKVPTKPKKPPIAVVRALAGALDDGDIAQQCAALYAAIEGLDTAVVPAAAAAAALAHTKKGTAVARAYLTVLAAGSTGDVTAAADEIVRHCAVMQRGRKAMRGVFVATWRRAHDLAAVVTACKNFARGIVDDPALLAVALETAEILGDPIAIPEHRARLERAKRLAPLVAQLRGTTLARSRATKQLAELSKDDLRHVHARVVDDPRAFEQRLAAAAVIALADDSQISDSCLSLAIGDMFHHGKDTLIAAWRSRVAAGDAGLIARLLGLFEWTALTATDADELEIYIHALLPVGGRPEVYAQVESALGSDDEVVREAICTKWLSEPDGVRAFSDRQIDRLIRMVVAIAEGGEHKDREAASRVLATVSHAGARHALIDAIKNVRTDRNKELRWSLYRGLARSNHPDAIDFFAERLIVEREEYKGLVDSLHDVMDAALHRRIMASLTSRATEREAIRAATLYADVLLADHRTPRLLVELARPLLVWQAANTDDQRRLRYVFEHATAAALAIKSPDDARAFLARARELPTTGLSDYHVVGLDKKTPSALADSDVKKRVAALEAGELDRELAEVRAQSDAARAASQPLEANDARLATLSGCIVSARFFEDRDRRIVWFFDQVGSMHVYDGYDVARPSFTVTGTSKGGIPHDGMAAFLETHTTISERALMFDGKHTRVREVLRLGDRLLVADGDKPNMRSWELIPVTVVGLRFENNADARAAFDRFAANPPAGMKRVDAWYVEQVGAVVRKYRSLRSDNSSSDARLLVLGKDITGHLDAGCPPIERKTYATGEAAVTAMQAWEGRMLARGGRLAEISIDRHATRREDTLLSAFLESRARDSTKGAAWHLRGLAEMLDAIADAGLSRLVPDIQVLAGPPASDKQIAEYQALLSDPLPAPLLEVWREVGSADFTCDTVAIKFLSPSEVIANRDRLRARLQDWSSSRFKGKELAELLAGIADVDIIATHDGDPLILFDTKQKDAEGRYFTLAGSTSASSLASQIGDGINHELEVELVRRLGDVYRLRLGQRAGAATRRVRLAKGDQEFEAIVDGSELLTRTLTVKHTGLAKLVQHSTPEAAAAAFDVAVEAAKRKGFEPVEQPG